MNMHPLKGIAQGFFFVSVIACLSACSSLSLKTAWSLKTLDYMALKPGDVRLALALPEGANFKRVTMTQQFKYKEDEEMLIDQTIDLEVITSGEEFDRAGLPYAIDNLLILRVPQSRVDDVQNFQNVLNAERVAGKGGSASFGFDSKLNPEWLKSYCEKTSRPLYLSAWILVDEAQGYLPLLKESQLGKLLDLQTQSICASD